MENQLISNQFALKHTDLYPSKMALVTITAQQPLLSEGTPGLFYKSRQSPRIPIKVPHTAEMGKYREYMERPKLTFKKKRYEHCREAFQFNSGVSDVVWRGLSVLLIFFFFLKSYVSLTLYNCIKEYNPMFMTKVTKFRFCRGLCLQGEPLFRCVPSV